MSQLQHGGGTACRRFAGISDGLSTHDDRFPLRRCSCAYKLNYGRSSALPKASVKELKKDREKRRRAPRPQPRTASFSPGPLANEAARVVSAALPCVRPAGGRRPVWGKKQRRSGGAGGERRRRKGKKAAATNQGRSEAAQTNKGREGTVRAAARHACRRLRLCRADDCTSARQTDRGDCGPGCCPHRAARAGRLFPADFQTPALSREQGRRREASRLHRSTRAPSGAGRGRWRRARRERRSTTRTSRGCSSERCAALQGRARRAVLVVLGGGEEEGVPARQELVEFLNSCSDRWVRAAERRSDTQDGPRRPRSAQHAGYIVDKERALRTLSATVSCVSVIR